MTNTAPTFTVSSGAQIVSSGEYWTTAAFDSAVVAGNGILVADVAGYPSRLQLRQLTIDGALDTGFGSGGVAAISYEASFSRIFESMVVQPDGKILLPMPIYTEANELIVLRLNADGSYDDSFAENGVFRLPVAGVNSYVADVAVQANGQIVFLARIGAGDDVSMVTIRVSENGELDTAYGQGGVSPIETYVNPLNPEYDIWGELPHALLAQADGGMLVGTYDQIPFANPDAHRYLIRRLNEDGSLDTDFGAEGFLHFVNSSYSRSFSFLEAPDGGVFFSGVVGGSDPLILKFTSEGQPDPVFGDGGQLFLEERDSNSAVLALQSDGKLLVAGGGSDITVIRLNVDGSLDETFGNQGFAVIDLLPHGRATVWSVTLLPEGEIVVTGGVGRASEGDSIIVTLTSNGGVRTAFSEPEQTVDRETVYYEGGEVTWLDMQVSAVDVELMDLGNYGGATFSISRLGGAASEDLFFAMGKRASAFVTGAELQLDGELVGTVLQNDGGVLQFQFSTGATQIAVNAVLSSIGYQNTSLDPSSEVQLEWTFSDGNTGDQGDGGELSGTALQTVEIVTVNDSPSMAPSLLIELSPQDGDYPVTVDGVVDVADPEGDILTFSIATGSVAEGTVVTESVTPNGTFRLNASSGAYTYEPAASEAGVAFVDFITVEVSDGEYSDMQVITIGDFAGDPFAVDDPTDDGILVDAAIVGESGWRIEVDDAWLYRAYSGVLGRTPDNGGFDWWSSQIAAGTHTLESMVWGFIWSPEFLSNFDGVEKAHEIEPADFVRHMYENVFGREADEAGYLWWVNELESRNRNQAQVVIDMTQSNEFIGLTAVAMVDYLVS